jgi:phage FluMu gp28-like protein
MSVSPPLSPQSLVLSTSFLFAGIDVARHHDQTVITILEKLGSTYILRALLRLRDMRLPDQQQQLETILNLPNLKHAKIDMTGLGLGLFEYTHQKFPTKITGVNFSSTIPLHTSSQNSVLSVSSVLIRHAPTTQTIRITEALATQLLQSFEDRALQIPIDQDLRDDLRKPERLVSPSGRVSIAATRDATGHADHFWSLALALNAAQTPVRPPPASAPVYLKGNFTGGRAMRKHKIERE